MARTIAIWAPTALATPTCKLMLESDLTTVVETITLGEHGTVKRLYTGTVTAAAGHYRYNLLTAGAFIGGGSIYVGATDATTYEEDGFGYLPGTTVAGTGVLTEAYRATGQPGTLAQLLYEILAGLLDHSISGTTKTTRKIDGTPAKTYTLDSATNPTSITETS